MEVCEQEKLNFLSHSKNVDSRLTLNLRWHEIPLRFRFESEESQRFFMNYLPENWIVMSNQTNPALEVQWLDLKLSSKNVIPNWENHFEPNLTIVRQNHVEKAVQRDFVGEFDHVISKIKIVSIKGFSDGYFNALRWFMPRILAKQNKAVLHSSCVVGNDGRAYLFLGHSGAGKTTTASRAEERLVLGDDINLLSLDENQKAFVESAALGQNPRYQGPLGKRFPLAGFFFIRKAHKNSKRLIKPPTALKRLLSCTYFGNWECANSEDSLNILKLLKSSIQSTNSYELDLTLSKNFWGEIHEQA